MCGAGVMLGTGVRVKCKTRPIINNSEGGEVGDGTLSHCQEGKCRHHPQP